jgi:hypothetical protein
MQFSKLVVWKIFGYLGVRDICNLLVVRLDRFQRGWIIEYALKNGMRGKVARYDLDLFKQYPKRKATFHFVREGCSLEVAKWIYNHDTPTTRYEFNKLLVNWTAKYGNLEVMKWVLSKKPHFIKPFNLYDYLCGNVYIPPYKHPITEKTLINAVEGNNPDILRWLFTLGFEPTGRVFDRAITTGNVAIMKKFLAWGYKPTRWAMSKVTDLDVDIRIRALLSIYCK